MLISFLFFLSLFVGIGLLSASKAKKTNADYLLAGNGVKPWLVALSAVATNNSGFMFIAMIGWTYVDGLVTMWFLLGFIVGDMLASVFIHKKIRNVTEKMEVLSFAGVLSNWNGTDYRIVRMVSGLIIIGFLGTYAAAQLSAGGKGLHVLLGWNYDIGAIIGAFLILLYCFAGGLRASIWTDAAQSFVMIFAMALLLYVSITGVGGWDEFITALRNVSPDYLNPLAVGSPIVGGVGVALFFLGWIFAGFGVIGQPHIMVRFMAMEHPEDITRIRYYYYIWSIVFSILTLGVGLAARLILPEVSGFDAELALPVLAQNLLPEILVGVVLAGLFAATMSTADSQVLSCSAAVTQDFPLFKSESYWATKIATVSVLVMALLIALFFGDSVFVLVTLAWAGLASAFAPLLTVYALGGRPSEKTVLLMIVFGVGAMLLWYKFELDNITYKALIGILFGFVPFFWEKFVYRK